MPWSAARTARSGRSVARGAERTRRRDGPTHVRPAGEECAEGEVLAPAGTVLTPALIGLAAAAGHDELLVVPAPRVALVLFGDELATAGVPRSGAGARLAGPAGTGVGGPDGCRRGPRGALRGHARRPCRGDPACDCDRRCGADDRVARPRGRSTTCTRRSRCARARCSSTAWRCAPGIRCWRRRWIAVAPGWSGCPGNPQSAIVTLMSLGRADPGRVGWASGVARTG